MEQNKNQINFIIFLNWCLSGIMWTVQQQQNEQMKNIKTTIIQRIVTDANDLRE